MKFISYDLGTGGVKASLYDEQMNTLAKSFIEYATFYPQDGYHEQKPMDWWEGIIGSTQKLLSETGTDPKEISCLALSGHSCCAVPVDAEGNLIDEYVPIWSDTRAEKTADRFFEKVDPTYWYMTTGNGFPAPCYAAFKLMWMRENRPETFARIETALGSKDFINFKLTGNKYTDYSYASSFGVYDLKAKAIDPKLLEASGIPASFFPEIVPSHFIVGKVTKEAAEATGLAEGTAVACGGVDNACMAMGAVGAEDGRVYVSLGSSSWIPINSKEPVLDDATRPYVFAHIDENMFTSAYSIFAGGSSHKWAKNTLCKDFADDKDAFSKLSALAATSPVGSNGIFFNPSLAGGTSQDKSIHIRGSYVGVHLGTTREDMLRAAMEGIAMNLRMSLDNLSRKVTVSPEILFCGGGSKDKFWMQMFADIFGKEIVKTNIDQDAASLGAAAVCARAMGIWEDYSKIIELHKVENRNVPNPENVAIYEKLLPVFAHICDVCADLGDYMHEKLSL